MIQANQQSANNNDSFYIVTSYFYQFSIKWLGLFGCKAEFDARISILIAFSAIIYLRFL